MSYSRGFCVSVSACLSALFCLTALGQAADKPDASRLPGVKVDVRARQIRVECEAINATHLRLLDGEQLSPLPVVEVIPE